MKELGEKVGVTESAIQQYEVQKRKPDYELLLKLSEALECTVDDLLHGPSEVESLPDDLEDLRRIWDQLSDGDKAIIRIITQKYI